MTSGINHSRLRHRSSCFEILEGIGLYRCTQVLRPGGPGAVAISIRGHACDADNLHLEDSSRLMLRIDASMVSSNGHDQARSTNETSSYSMTEVRNILRKSPFCNDWLRHTRDPYLYLNACDVVIESLPVTHSLQSSDSNL